MKISVIIPVYNSETTIIPCLESLVQQSVSPLEIIIVNNNSSDGTINKIKEYITEIKKPHIILTSESKQGPAAARNKGIQLASGGIIAFTDSDCVVRKDWIKNAIAIYEKEDIDLVGGVVK